MLEDVCRSSLVRICVETCGKRQLLSSVLKLLNFREYWFIRSSPVSRDFWLSWLFWHGYVKTSLTLVVFAKEVVLLCSDVYSELFNARETVVTVAEVNEFTLVSLYYETVGCWALRTGVCLGGVRHNYWKAFVCASEVPAWSTQLLHRKWRKKWRKMVITKLNLEFSLSSAGVFDLFVD